MASELTWVNVGISLTFVLFDIGVSSIFRLGIGLSLLIAGLRCVGQLALVATLLHEVFETKNPWLIFLICCVFVLPSFSIQENSSFIFVFSHVEFLGHIRDGYVQLCGGFFFDKLTSESFCSYKQIFETVSLYGRLTYSTE